MYQIEWDMKIESELNASHEARSGALVTVRHVSKSLSKITYFIGNPEEISS